MNKPFFILGKLAIPMDGKSDLISDPVIEVLGNKIVDIRSQKDFTPPADSKVLEARDCLLMPGLINTHTHSPMSLLRGIAEDLPFHKWLFEKVMPVEQKAVSREFVYLGSLLSAVEMIKSGTTCFNDMYYFAEDSVRAAHEAGMRMVASVTYLDNSLVDPYTDKQKKFDEFGSIISKYPRALPAVGPHAIYTVGTESFKEIVLYAKKNDWRVHIHLSETEHENKECLAQHRKSPTEYLNELGFWDLKATAAHAAVLSGNDFEILSSKKVGIAHCPESNLKLGTQIADIKTLKEKGARVGLATDSCASNNNLDLLQEVDFATKLQLYKHGPGQWTTKDSVRMLTIEGAKALHLDSEIGSLEVGKKADIIAIDLNLPHATPLFNPYYHLCFSAVGSDVKHSVIDGEIVMKDRVVQLLNERHILKQATEFALTL